jgi:hypothetical protein
MPHLVLDAMQRMSFVCIATWWALLMGFADQYILFFRLITKLAEGMRLTRLNWILQPLLHTVKYCLLFSLPRLLLWMFELPSYHNQTKSRDRRGKKILPFFQPLLPNWFLPWEWKNWKGSKGKKNGFQLCPSNGMHLRQGIKYNARG